ncbi:uncharacterized protein LOC141649136 [Silene latifolia]|uniref:uncharacterized protein LOC141649136 n=1 Tax=Silene latifolia TaxID=37657 RepID=UPI003D78440C
MTDYQLVEHEWFSICTISGNKWIPAYFKDVSMSGLMRVTSRSESENSFFDRFLTPHLTLVEFWVCYESALEAQRHQQSKLNSDNKHSEIPRKTKSNLEVHASEMYSHNIFKDFQTELVAALSDCRFKDITWRLLVPVRCFREWACCAGTAFGFYTTKIFEKIPNKVHNAKMDKSAMSKPVFDKDGKSIDVSQKFSRPENVAECDDNDIKLLIEKLRDIRLDMISNRSVPAKKKDKIEEIEMYVGCKIPQKLVIHVPKKSKNKGTSST